MRVHSGLRRMSLVAALSTVLLVGVAPATADAAALWCDKVL